MKKYIGVLVIGVLLIGIGMSTMEVGSSNDNNNGVKINIPEAPINYSLVPTVNSSDYWDSLDDVNNTQFNNEGGTLTIDESWISGLWSGLWCALTGCVIDGDLNVTGTIIAGDFIGDGSGLTNLPGDVDNDFHIFFNGSMYTNINYNLTAGDVDDVEVLTQHGRKFIFGDTFT